MGWPGGGGFQPGAGIKADFKQIMLRYVHRDMFFLKLQTCIVKILVRKQENILT